MTRTRIVARLCLWLAVAVAAGGFLHAQQSPAPASAGTAAISGVVTDGTTKRPIAGAIVSIVITSAGSAAPNASSRRAQVTDAAGRFVFRDLAAAETWALTAEKFGYFSGRYGSGLTSRISLADGQWMRDANVTLNRPASISGTVIDEQGEPVVGASVRLFGQVLIGGQPQLATGPSVKTDDRGVYRAGALQPGRYLVSVAVVQQSVPATITSVQLAGLTPQSVAFYESQGRPLPTGDPTLHIDGDAHLVLGRAPMPSPSADGRPLVYRSVFFPSAASPRDATPIELKFGEDRAGVDLRLEPVPAVRISGVVQGEPDAMAGLTLRLFVSGGDDGDGYEAATTLVGEGGRFTFLNVPAGAYTLVARRTSTRLSINSVSSTSSYSAPGETSASMSSSSLPGSANVAILSFSSGGNQGFWSRVPISVEGRDLTGVIVPMQKAISISGRVVREGALQPGFLLVSADPARGTATLSGAPSFRPPGSGDPDSFSVGGLIGGEYVLRVGVSGVIKSIVWDGNDYTNKPFDTSSGRDFNDVVLTLTDQAATVSGSVHDARGGPAADAGVIIFPVERDRWLNYGYSPARIKSTVSTTAGTYRIPMLPAGEYFVVAVSAADVNGWQDPKFLERMTGTATRVTLEWGGKATVELVLR